MSLETIRVAVVTAVEAAKASFSDFPLVIEYDDVIIVDTKTQQNPFLQVQIKVLDANQVDLSDNPMHRFIGQIIVCAASKAGDGSSKSNKLLDFFYPKLQRAYLGGVRTYMASPAPKKEHLGWVYRPVLIPFWYDKTY